MKVGVGSQLASTKQGKNLQQMLKSAQVVRSRAKRSRFRSVFGSKSDQARYAQASPG